MIFQRYLCSFWEKLFDKALKAMFIKSDRENNNSIYRFLIISEVCGPLQYNTAKLKQRVFKGI